VLTKFEGCILIEDEIYVKLDFKQFSDQKYYIATKRGNVNPKFKYILHDKYVKMLMIWQVLCSCGKKITSFITSATMDRHMYIKECLKKRLLSLIHSHNSPVKFWPDLASCHYAGDTIEWYRTNNIDFIPKNHNPQNCPNLRQIKEYWSIVKGILRKSGWAAKDINSMRLRWYSASD